MSRPATRLGVSQTYRIDRGAAGPQSVDQRSAPVAHAHADAGVDADENEEGEGEEEEEEEVGRA